MPPQMSGAPKLIGSPYPLSTPLYCRRVRTLKVRRCGCAFTTARDPTRWARQQWPTPRGSARSLRTIYPSAPGRRAGRGCEPESEEAELDEVVWDDAEPEPESDEPWDDGWDSEWGEPSAVKPGLGPQLDEGGVLKSLPGTKAGESGWYFDGEGKPSLWEFRPFGWERIE